MDGTLMLLEMGKGEVVLEGPDVLMLPVGSMVYPACEAARQLRREGIQATVVNPRFIKPLDSSLVVAMAREIGKVVTIEENVLAGGFGSAVIELIQEGGLSYVEVLRMGIPDQFLDHGPQGVLRKKCGLDARGIMERVKSFLGGRVRLEQPGFGFVEPRESRATSSIQ